MNDLTIFNDPDVILTQTQAAVSVPVILAQNVSGGAVTDIGGAKGSAITITGSASSGWTISASGVGNQLTFSLSVSNAGIARTNLGLGALATLNAGAAVANSGVVAGATYSQADFQAVIDKLNALLNSLRTAGIIAT